MRSEIKTAIMMGAIIVGIVAIASLALQQVSDDYVPPVIIDTGNGAEVASIDKSRLKMAPEIAGIAEYINTTPEQLEEKIEGSVVLYDIWTYSCINCVRTLPYITAWNEKYADQGLLIIGIHSPEFEFEKDLANVETAVQKHGITYPVVLDNDWDTWDAFENRYWPRKYIADHEGYIRYDHIGEGGYKETEKVIQDLLQERSVSQGMGAVSAVSLVDIEEFEHTRTRTPELYLGYELAFGRDQIGNEQGFRPNETVMYTHTDSLQQNRFYMSGDWSNNADHMKMVSDAGSITLPYTAKQVNIVASGQTSLEILIDGRAIDPLLAGADMVDGMLMIDGAGLYNIIDAESSDSHLIEILVNEPGFEMYTFTFG